MPNTKSAKKALRSSTKKKEYNFLRKIKIKNALKEFRKAIQTNPSEYKNSLSKAFSALDKAVKTNLIPKNRADRKKSRLSAQVDKALGTIKTETTKKPKSTATKSKAITKKTAEIKKTAVVKKPTKTTASKKPLTNISESESVPAKKPAAKKASTTKKAEK